MDWKFVLALVFALIVAVFALQNAVTVDITFLTWEFSFSQALVILLSASFGALVVLLLSLVRWIKGQAKIKGLLKNVTSLEQENKQLKMRLQDLETSVSTAAAETQEKNSPLTQ